MPSVRIADERSEPEDPRDLSKSWRRGLWKKARAPANSALLRAWRGGSSAAKGVSYSGYARKYLDNVSSCWWQVDDRDGMEFGISGNGCRPTINAVLYGEAQAIVELAAWLGNASIVAEFVQHHKLQ